jgi:hypothetical protein
MPRRISNPWLSLTMDAWALSLEASTVMSLRALKLAAGGAAAEAEALRMVTEKIEAGMALQAKAMTGAIGTGHAAAHGALKHYRRKVRANRRRLSR